MSFGIAYATPGVWQQLEHGLAQKGLVTNVELIDRDLVVEIQGQDASGEPVTFKRKLCEEKPSPELTESTHAVHLSLRHQALTAARAKKATVEFASRGPWSPCLSFVREVQQ